VCPDSGTLFAQFPNASFCIGEVRTSTLLLRGCEHSFLHRLQHCFRHRSLVPGNTFVQVPWLYFIFAPWPVSRLFPSRTRWDSTLSVVRKSISSGYRTMLKLKLSSMEKQSVNIFAPHCIYTSNATKSTYWHPTTLTPLHLCTLTHLHTYTLTHLHTYTLTHLHTYTLTHLHTYTVTNLHTYTLTR
jgi:hypothetical protein